jgi:hypothetical protein
MVAASLGGGSFCDLPYTFVRLFTDPEPTGWSFSAYDLERKYWLLWHEPADDEEQARMAALAWAFGAGLIGHVELKWKPKEA